MDVARAVDSDSMSEHLQTRRHPGSTLSQRRSDLEDFESFQLKIQGIPLENVHLY